MGLFLALAEDAEYDSANSQPALSGTEETIRYLMRQIVQEAGKHV